MTRHLLLAVVIAATGAGCSSGALGSGGAPASTVSGTSRPPSITVSSPASSGATSLSASASHSTSATRSTQPVPRAPRRATPIPPVSAKARAAGLVDVRTVVPDALVNLRYATTSNFTRVRLYPLRARCLIHHIMSRGLTAAAARLRRLHLVIVFWDCYRPHAVQVRMFRIVSNPNWVARPGPYARSHEAARSIDITVARASIVHHSCMQRVQRHCLLNMGTGFDNFTPRAFAYATTGVSRQARADRALLRRAMAAGGITVYSGEWWHFDGPGAGANRPHLDSAVY